MYLIVGCLLGALASPEHSSVGWSVSLKGRSCYWQRKALVGFGMGNRRNGKVTHPFKIISLSLSLLGPKELS